MEAFVNAKEPLATDVDFDLLLFSDPAYSMDFKNVPLDKMDQIEGEPGTIIVSVWYFMWCVLDVLMKTIDQILKDGPDKFDMDRMHTLSKII